MYCIIKKCTRSDNDVEYKLNKMATKIAVQVNDEIFNGKNTVSVIVFIQEFKAACNVSNIHEGAVIWLLKYYLNGSLESIFKARVALPF